MSQKKEDLWPEDFKIKEIETPVSILKRQASFLGEKTDNVVKADITTRYSGDEFFHSFYLVAPALDNYRYRVFTVTHGISLYPLGVHNTEISIKNEGEFKTFLRAKFASERFQKIIWSLIAQSKGE